MSQANMEQGMVYIVIPSKLQENWCCISHETTDSCVSVETAALNSIITLAPSVLGLTGNST